MATTQAPAQVERPSAPPAVADDGRGLLIGALVVAIGVATLMLALEELFVDAIPPTLILVGLGVWAYRSPSKVARWLLAAFTIVFLGMNLQYAIPDLMHPESPFAFAPTLAIIGGGAITIAVAVLAALGRRVPHGTVWLCAAAAACVAVVGSLVAAAGVDDDTIEPGDTEIVASDYEYPAEVDVDGGAVFVHNADRFRHTFVIDGEVSPVEIPANTDVRIELDLAPGPYRYYCDIAGHEDMEGILTIR